jgi:signal transduction histidine kinase
MCRARRNGYHRHMGSSDAITMPTLTRREQIADTLFAVVLLAAVWLQMWIPRFLFDGGRRIPREMLPFGRPDSTPAAAYLLVALCILPLAFRRRYPLAVLAVIAGATSLYQLVGYPPTMALIGMLIALYTVGTLVDRRRLMLWAAACGGLVIGTGIAPWGETMFWADLARSFSILAVAAALGDATRNRRAYVAEVEQRAIEAERTREEEAARRVDEERLRIARELHDITAHSLSIVAVQSGAALHVLDTDPDAARGALVAIRATSRDALNELRAILGVLRGSGEAAEGAPLAPTPGVSRIADLIAPLRDAGLTVALSAPNGGDPLPAFVDSSAYRIVQEALTNVLRHAGTASVSVTLRRSDDTLSVEVVDDGAGAPAPASAADGHGITGMRERALALGGTFEAGPVKGGGWRVAATLPLSGRTAP